MVVGSMMTSSKTVVTTANCTESQMAAPKPCWPVRPEYAWALKPVPL